MAVRKFPCMAKHMAETLKDQVQGWQPKKGDPCNTVREFFRLIVLKRNPNRFDVLASERGNDWAPEDEIHFYEKTSRVECATATLVRVVSGPWRGVPDGDPPGDETARHHFVLREIDILYSRTDT